MSGSSWIKPETGFEEAERSVIEEGRGPLEEIDDSAGIAGVGRLDEGRRGDELVVESQK